MADPLTIKLDTKKLDDLLKQIGSDLPTLIIEDGVEYGVYVEFGTNRMAARPALVPAFDRHTRDLAKLIEAAIEQRADVGDALRAVAFNIQRDWAGNVPVDTGALRNSIHVREE